ncbi:hypothetical protein [Kutzneria chonburiensis]|uniref:Uncharacterized protein n=1 Tax=Kutzneria chonburiensis TaxID=1483604 RepID=A0ABV6MMQ6_9PSEU|nr:hypothetical protein [Kutzneria chonburiensis]
MTVETSDPTAPHVTASNSSVAVVRKEITRLPAKGCHPDWFRLPAHFTVAAR